MADNEPRQADNKSREVGELSITINADMSEAITGFKALQREIRNTTKALREYEKAQKEAFLVVIDGAKCGVCNDTKIVSIGKGIRGVKKCGACSGRGEAKWPS